MAKKSQSPYRCKTKPFGGTQYVQIAPQARVAFKVHQKRTKRRPYIRSVYFNKEKIFFDFFWQHMSQKSLPDRARRLKYFSCALELLRECHHDPETFIDSAQSHIIRHRFVGIAPDGVEFFVQVKEDKRTNRKQLISIFPTK